MAQARKEGKPHDNALGNPLGKNPGDVWKIPTYPFPGSHFAVFPPDLIEPIIKASSPVNGTILDPFAGSGTTARVCVEENRHSIMVDSDKKTLNYFDKHLAKKGPSFIHKPFEQYINKDLDEILSLIDETKN